MNLKKIKGAILLLLVSSLFLLFTGCGSKKVGLMDAFENNNKIKSFAYKANIDFNFELEEMKAAGLNLDKFNLKLEGKGVTEDGKHVKAQSNVKFNIFGINADMDLFQETSTDENDKVKTDMFIEIPQFLKLQAGPIFENIDYVYINSESLEQLANEMDGAEEAVIQSGDAEDLERLTNLQKSLNKFIMDYTDENGKGIIEDTGKQEVIINDNKENLQTYKISMDSEGIQKLLKTYLEDEKKAEDLVSIMNSLNSGVNSLQDNLDKDQLIELIDQIPLIIGQDGITLEFAVKDGYVVHQRINTNIIVEEDQIHVDLVIDMFDINKEVKIEMPTVDDDNTIDYLELITLMTMGM